MDEKYRNLGFGKKLLSAAEEIAEQRGCKIILLDTFSFQAPDFYIKNGYDIYATLDNCPEGHKKYYFKKVIG
ncbi:MAG: GNAT family N-acetyltransferase [Ruminiclostridium sp.]